MRMHNRVLKVWLMDVVNVKWSYVDANLSVYGGNFVLTRSIGT